MLSSVTASSLLAFSIVCCVYIFQCSYAYASASLNWTGEPMSSRNCVERIASTQDKLGDGCVQPVCGSLNTTSEPFEERLTQSCKAVLQKYTAKESSLSWATSSAYEEECETVASSQHPTNPVVVQTGFTSNFGFCSVPKAACSQIRSLLFVVTRYPDPVNWYATAPRLNMCRFHLKKFVVSMTRVRSGSERCGGCTCRGTHPCTTLTHQIPSLPRFQRLFLDEARIRGCCLGS